MNDLFDILEICLNEIENGADLESVLARYPEQAGELRPILKTAIQARNAAVPEPSPEVTRRGRSRLMQRAAEMRESKVAPRKRVIPAFQRLAISFSLAALLLMSSTGLLNASASALPGENLYPVKRGWESIRLLLIFDAQARKLLEFEFENERLHEVNELLSEGRGETISFAGIFMQLNGKTYVSGVPVLLAAGMENPSEGTAVIVSGRTNSQGIVEVETLELLTGSVLVPEGKPVEMELESDFGPGGEALYEIEGVLDAVSSNTLLIGDFTVYLDNPSTDWHLCIGMLIEVKGYYAADGRFMAVEVEGKGSCSHQQRIQPAEGASQDVNTNEAIDTNTNDTSTNANGNESNTNDDANDNGSGNDNSNDGGSGNGNDDQGDEEDDSGGGANDNDDSDDGGANDNGDGDSNTNDDSNDDNSSNDNDADGNESNDNESNENLNSNDGNLNNNNSNGTNDNSSDNDDDNDYDNDNENDNDSNDND